MNIKELLLNQLNYNKQKNILYKDSASLMGTGIQFSSALKKFSENEIDEMLIEFVASEFIKAIYRVNQFINVSTEKKEELKNIYRHSWEKISGTESIEEVLYKYHYPALSDWLSSIYPPIIREYLREQKEIGNIVCEEYTPQFQVEILQIDIKKLMQPVLDIGCGGNANLVNFFRQNNIEAYGIDRLIENETEYIANADWLTYNFKSGQWGTIISNAAFSNHVMYTAKYEKEKLKDYLVKYNEIISSLKPGGEFIYAPGLPFIEERLDKKKYEVSECLITWAYYLAKIKKKLMAE